MVGTDAISRLAKAIAQAFAALSLSGPTARLAFRTALSSVAAVLAGMLLQLECPYWAGITAIAIVQTELSATFDRSIDRCLGTLGGAALGYFGAGFVGEHLIFQSIIAGAVAFGVYGSERSPHGYAALLGAITVILIMFGALETPHAALELAVNRALEVMTGVSVVYLVEFIAAPPAEPHPVQNRPGIFAPPVDADLLATAVTGGFAAASIPVIWEALQLPGLSQTPITAFVILAAMRRAPLMKALNRLAGCFLGGLYGLWCMRFVDDNTVLWLVLMFAGLYVASHVKHGSGDAADTGQQAGIAIILAMVQGLSPSDDLLPAINRLVGIVGGIVVAASAQAFLAPFVAPALIFVLRRTGALANKTSP